MERGNEFSQGERFGGLQEVQIGQFDRGEELIHGLPLVIGWLPAADKFGERGWRGPVGEPRQACSEQAAERSVIGFSGVTVTLIGGRVCEPGNRRWRNEDALSDLEEFGQRSVGVVKPGKRNDFLVGGIGPKDGFRMLATACNGVPVEGGGGYRQGSHGPFSGLGMRSRAPARGIGASPARVRSAGLRSSLDPVRSMASGGSDRKCRETWERCCGIRMEADSAKVRGS